MVLQRDTTTTTDEEQEEGDSWIEVHSSLVQIAYHPTHTYIRNKCTIALHIVSLNSPVSC